MALKIKKLSTGEWGVLDGDEVVSQYTNKRDALSKIETSSAKLDNERARLRRAKVGNKGERCKFCDFYDGKKSCKIIDGPVNANQICNWIQSRKAKNVPTYKVSEKDWLAFVEGMKKTQPYQHKVIDGALTPAGPLVLIEDTAKPEHYFSLPMSFHIEHTSLEHP